MSSFDRLKTRGSRVMRLGYKVWRQVRQEFPAALLKSANGVRLVGAKTRRDRAITLRKFVFWVVAEFEIHSVTHLKRKHIQAYCKDLEERKLRPATIATELSHLAVLFRQLGKSQLLDDRDSLFSDPSILRRNLVATRDKSIEGAGLDFEVIFAAADALNPRVAVQLALCWYFGLRAQEAWCFRPHLAVQDGFVCVNWGTKGGRRRSLSGPLTDEQWHLIELAKTFAATAPESTVPRGCSLKKWKAIFYRVTRRIGLTRAKLGVTPHSLRHSYAQRQYQRVTWHLTPVQGGTLAEDDGPADSAAREIVSSELGHSRASIASAYIGGTRVTGEGKAEQGGAG
ncbi:tyrosine-type recombinase/integrase [Peristeroidobacter soli]|uniref:tyrosine-type recombinase/integrase n=1 Tax=Peristeroidobacter soli TaxID=2497877 RepID=UPI00101D2EA9|nr:integrase domain-containing protein [Peristeroidobacter soli]